MSELSTVRLLADYNQWMNGRLFEVTATLPEAVRQEDRGAFFGSIENTLNHLLVADTLWLKRFAVHPACIDSLAPITMLPTPPTLDAQVRDTFAELHLHRLWLDQQIVDWCGDLGDGDLDYVLSYRNSKGVASRRRFGSLLTHFFNHQTHHRGQVTTLLSQAGVDVGVTDLLVRIADELQ
ncbi:DinB family protein [Alcanivorax sp.]|uniref:DinB family protein n=1 Tax=Alcanivorax sp. TaxID=1872427 RepID=UPI000C0E0E5E|nr:DinB family protein [Alcanivorax sp.]PHR66727.1 MAG: damage-inducible protein DinB [Alcanivorax sp.]